MPTSPSSLDSISSTSRTDEEEKILRQFGLGNSSLLEDEKASIFAESENKSNHGLHPVLAFGLCCGLTINIGMLMSLPMVLMNRGAPYVPTFSKRAHLMFRQLRQFNTNKTKRISEQTLVDLGSGDGRLVAHAASEGYKLAIGYELNPALHVLATMRRFTSWQLISGTRFYWQDLWKVPLQEADVVVVVSECCCYQHNSRFRPIQYGWGSIMAELQIKLEKELRPGSIVVSNVFALPRWKPTSVVDNVYLYITPNCFGSVSTTTTASRETQKVTETPGQYETLPKKSV